MSAYLAYKVVKVAVIAAFAFVLGFLNRLPK